MNPAGQSDARPPEGSGLGRLRRRLAERIDPEPEELFAAIASQVAERRREWNLSQKELSELCGTTQSAIARLEAGKRPPRIDTLARVASALDCHLVVELKAKTKGRTR